MQNFQPILIVIGILAIAAVLIHGYILNRREKIAVSEHSSDREEILSAKTEANCADGIIGDVHVIRAYKEDDISCDFSVPLEDEEVNELDFADQLPHQVFSGNAEKETLDDDFLEQLNHPEQEDEVELESEQAELKNSDTGQQQSVAEVQDIFIFNVVAKEGAHVRGHELLQFFLTAGFRFGDMSIFHRHLHSDGTGPVLFSIANMMAPGVFDPENMEQFSSQGVSFFLTAPNQDIDIKNAFDMMLIAVEQMAEEFDCLVLNADRELLTEEQFRNYHERLLHYV